MTKMILTLLALISIACVILPGSSVVRNMTYPVGIQSFITVNNQESLEGKYGCTATNFMSDATIVSVDEYSLKIHLSDPCTSFDETYTKKDAVIVLKNYNCTAYEMAEMCVESGAGAVIIASNIPGQPVYTLPTASTLPKLNIISGMIDNTFYIALKEVLLDTKPEEQTQQQVMANLNEIKSYDIAKDYPEVYPDHNPTVLTVTSPFELKWRYPVVMASYNPKQTNAVTSKLVAPTFREECTPAYNIADGLNTLESMCGVCWELESPFENEINDGNIVMFNTYGWNSRSNNPPQPWCFYNDYPTITHLAQETGAEAVIFVGDSFSLFVLGPYLSPYSIDIASYYITRPEGLAMLDGIRNDKYPDIIAKLPPIKNGSGPEYYLQELDLRVVPETQITIDEIANGKSMTYIVGQATYNPDKYEPQVLKVMRGIVDPSCAVNPNSDELNLQGVDCNKCGDILHSKIESIFKWDGRTSDEHNITATPAALLVFSKELYCVDSWAIAVNEAAQFLGVKAVLFGNSGDYTTTHVSADANHGEDKAVVPGFNIRKRDAEAINESIENNFVPIVNIPAINNGISEIEVGNMENRLHEMIGAEVKMSGPESLKGIHIAGQSAYNPTTHPGLDSELLVKVHMHPACNPNTSQGCHGCELLSSPFYHPVSMEGNIAFILEEDTHCLKPMANYAKFAEEAGAVGVLFSNELNHVIGMGPEEDFGLSIPSFNINRDTGVAVDEKLRAFGNIYLSFPPLTESLAPENYYSIQELQDNEEQFVEPTTTTSTSSSSSNIATTKVNVAPTGKTPQPEEEITTTSSSSTVNDSDDGTGVVESSDKEVKTKRDEDVGTTDEPIEKADGTTFSTAIYASSILIFMGFLVLVVYTVVRKYIFVHNYEDLDEGAGSGLGGEKPNASPSVQPSSSLEVDDSRFTVVV